MVNLETSQGGRAACREAPTRRRVAITHESVSERVGIDAVLQGDAGDDRGVAGSVVDGRPALRGSEKDFSQSAVLIMADTGNVAKSSGLDIQERVGAAISQPLAGYLGAGVSHRRPRRQLGPALGPWLPL